MFDAAHQAFDRGNLDDASMTLATHERMFPAGYFAEERETLRAQIAQRRSSSQSPQLSPLATAPQPAQPESPPSTP